MLHLSQITSHFCFVPTCQPQKLQFARFFNITCITLRVPRSPHQILPFRGIDSTPPSTIEACYYNDTLSSRCLCAYVLCNIRSISNSSLRFCIPDVQFSGSNHHPWRSVTQVKNIHKIASNSYSRCFSYPRCLCFSRSALSILKLMLLFVSNYLRTVREQTTNHLYLFHHHIHTRFVLVPIFIANNLSS